MHFSWFQGYSSPNWYINNKARYNVKGKYTWIRVPKAMALDASCIRSAACNPNIWTPRISPLSGLYINCTAKRIQHLSTKLSRRTKRKRIVKRESNRMNYIETAYSELCVLPWPFLPLRFQQGLLCLLWNLSWQCLFQILPSQPFLWLGAEKVEHISVALIRATTLL